MNDRQLQKLESILNIVNEDKVSPNEVIDLFNIVVKAIQELKTSLEKTVINSNQNQIQDTKSVISDLKAQIDSNNRDVNAKIRNILNEIKQFESKIPVIPPMPVMPDLSGIEDRITAIESEETIEETGESMVRKINTLKIEPAFQIDKEHIKGLDGELKRIESKMSVGKGGARKVPIVKRVSLTSQVDGNARSFTLPRDTVNIIGLWGTSFPITFDDADWTLAGNTVTLANGLVTPQSGQTLVAIVEVLFYG